MIFSILVVVLLAIAVIILDWKEIRQIIGKADWLLSIVALIFAIFSYLCLSLSYVIVNSAFGIKMGWQELFEIGLVSTALNNVLAFMGAAGHSLRLMLIGRRGGPVGDVLAASLFHSYLNNLIMLMVLVAGLFYIMASHTVYGGGAVGLGLISGLSAIFLVVSTAILFVKPLRAKVLNIVRGGWYIITRRKIDLLLADFDKAVTRSLLTLKGRRSDVVEILGFLAADWFFAVLTLWYCFQAFGGDPSLGIVVSGFGIGIAAGNLSFIPGGLGVQEASMAGVFALLGRSLGRAILASILFRVIYDFIPFLFSLVLYGHLIRGHFRPNKERNE